MKKQQLEQIIFDYICNKSHDEDRLFDELEYYHWSIQKWCGYSKDEYEAFEDSYNWENKRYEFFDDFIPFVLDHLLLAKKLKYSVADFIKITPAVERQLVVFRKKLDEVNNIHVL